MKKLIISAAIMATSFGVGAYGDFTPEEEARYQREKKFEAELQAIKQSKEEAYQAAKQREEEARYQREKKIKIEKKALAEAKKKALAEAQREEEARYQREKKIKIEKKALTEAQREEEYRRKAALRDLEQMMNKLAKEQGGQNKSKNSLNQDVDRYARSLKTAISMNIYNTSQYRGMYCIVQVEIDTTGLITGYKALSGNEKLCKAAENAMKITKRLPTPPSIVVYNKFKKVNFEFTF